MSKFNDLIIMVDDKWFWRKDDHNLKTFNGLSSETDLLEVVKPYLKGNRVVIQAGGNCGMQVVKFADHYASDYGFDNGDQAVDAVMEDFESSPNRELYLSYIGYLEQDTLKELDSNSIRHKILSLLVMIAPEHNIFDSQIASTMVYGIASKLKDEFTD